MNWEIQSYHWSSLRANGDSAAIPAALVALQHASSEQDALRAYWQIDNVVVVQGALFEAALPTANALLIGLTSCTLTARPHLLELLVQLTSGETAPSEIDHGNDQLAARCRGVLPGGLSVLLALLESGGPAEREHCVDLLGICAQGTPSARAQVVRHLTRLVGCAEGVTASLIGLAQSWLEALETSE